MSRQGRPAGERAKTTPHSRPEARDIRAQGGGRDRDNGANGKDRAGHRAPGRRSDGGRTSDRESGPRSASPRAAGDLSDQRGSGHRAASRRPASGPSARGGAPNAHASAEEVRPGERIVVTIKRLGINGEGVGYYRRKAVFVGGALTGEVVRASVSEVRPTYIKAELDEIEKRSSQRAEPPCPVYGTCGGCQLQHLSYEGQLEAKTELVREALRRYTGLDELPVRPTLGMAQPWDYRNKAQLQLERQGGTLLAGLYETGSHAVVDIGDCPIQHPQVNAAAARIKDVLQQLRIPVQGERGARTGQDVVKTVVVRHGLRSDELQVTLVASGERLPQREALVRRLREALPQAVGIALNVQPRSTPLVFGERTVTLWGAETMRESLGELSFTLSPRAFFQLNPQQTVRLYEEVRAAAGLIGHELVVDAYSGTGTIALWLAPHAREVRGIETIPEAVRDAQAAAAGNGLTSASFHVGAAEELLPRWTREGVRPDVIVADPPRTGLDARFLEAVLQTRPRRFVYVSCNPSTLAKDCKELLDGGYRIASVQPVDMFPQTSHVEVVIGMQRKDT
ncbi:23S rRNA (uracil(1939)-C(5))-methyltransferase RlmD [Paenibacillus sp. IB182496]|uniref:23S rRNA (Uracil(1939)-C(5))-methyltransferase RlmD n=2 Tax=Paenibacillus sabuli TaxID=2772509 RepID=A0A927BVT0_9BACL|nr:23S rRNA (uracil(1939)-C(5))-methyltransferase RlmD [Paenibacillus sabuli]MBD2846665.1 23S rRNA (uracil(1939)-C(5))-methyltransferase RlmD [Paenibacillus sabuli]